MTLEKLLHLIQTVSKRVKPSTSFKVLSRERIFERIEKKESFRWKNVVWQRLIAGALIVAMFFVYVIKITPPETVRAYVGEATVLKGQLNLEKDTGTVVVTSSAKLEVGDRLNIAPSSSVKVDFIDESSAVLSEGSVMKIDAFLVNTHDVKNSYVSLSLEKGEITGKVQKEETDAAQVKIQTPSGIIEANHSDFTIKVSDDDTKVTVLSNSVTVKAIDTDKKAVSNTPILAQAQPSEGYTVKIPKRGADSKVNPLQISPPKNDWNNNDTNTNKNADMSDNNNGTPSGDTPGPGAPAISRILTDTQEKQIKSNLDIAEVKLYQAIASLNDNNQTETLAALKDYRAKILAVYNIITGESRSDDYSKSDINSILGGSNIQETISALSELDAATRKELSAKLGSLYTIEKSTREKIVVASVTVVKSPDESNNSVITNPVEEDDKTNTNGTGSENSNASSDQPQSNGNDNTNSPTGNNDIDNSNKNAANTNSRNSLYELDNAIRFEIQHTVELVGLQTNLSEDKQAELEDLIKGSLQKISASINEIPEWKNQQEATKEILAQFPNKKMFEKSLQTLRSLSSDRVSFLFNEKLRKLK